MANPNPPLAGWADQSKPGWQQRALERVKARQKGAKRHTERRNGMTLYFDDPFRVLLDAAAERRGMSLAGYCRRAVAAMIAYDLGLLSSEVMQFTSRPTEYRADAGAGRAKRTNDDGIGFGPWRILGVAEVEKAEKDAPV
ncbi:hypothetical protein PBI_BEAGLE_19 [Arthrobacter phage Beagle]|nr:hypothetical protein PBI_BEAGLE_19 [Arthrobacter phage Beagle]QOP66770.1 ribbon-helix-helix DNA binding domain protein [Arthrobacter phage Odyssey395]